MVETISRPTNSGSPRAAASAAMQSVAVQPTGLVPYASQGRVLVAGPREAALAVAGRIEAPLEVTAVLTEGAAESRREAGLAVFARPRKMFGIEGHLGAFRIVPNDAGDAELAKLHFDLVLDLFETPLRTEGLPPPGYYRTEGGAERLEAVMGELPDMVGEFEKPKFFDYDPDICAHGRSGIQACSRCLDACPAGAIRSLLDLERIEVNPNLCQGGGICASVCPTGAIRYVYPSLKDQLERVRQGLKAYREAGGVDPVILLHASGATPEPPAANVIPVPLEELAAGGPDLWLSALAYGARAVWLYRDALPPDGALDALEEQRRMTVALLEGLGGAPGALVWVAPTDPRLASGTDAGFMPVFEVHAFAALGGKRSILNLAIDRLVEALHTPAGPIPLPEGAPFGQVLVDRERCTLCMSCVGVCPAKALSAGGDEPLLSFFEQNCVQCGLCERACPEDAIALKARLLPDPHARAEARTLNQEAAFKCVRCGKPFATQKVIDRITAKLSDHPMFRDPEALRRLQMCEDCRVRDMFESGRQVG